MDYRVLATDYDGTLATHGSVDDATIASLRRFLRSGRKLLLVTGRQVDDLRRVFPQLDMFDLVVAENGALIFDPRSHHNELLCEPVAAEFVRALQERRVPVWVGRAIVATEAIYEQAARDAIAESGLDLEITLNKGSLMVLPSGVDKASGLKSALEQMGVPATNVVGIGDGENDAVFLEACGCGVAVANALPQIKAIADFVTSGAHGAGVAEIIDQLLTDHMLVCHTGHGSLRSEFPD